MPGTFHGIKVLDLACDMPGAYACMLLGDMGAEIVRIEPPAGDPLHARPDFRMWNRGRRSVNLDVSSAAGREVLERLLSRSDVLVATTTPGAVRQGRLDFDTLRLVNPLLVYCAISPFGESHPMADLPADDGVVNAYAGVYGDQGGWQEPPIYSHLPIASYAAAFLAALGVSAALYARESTRKGQKVDVSMLAACLAMQTGSIVVGPRVRSWARDARGQQGANPVYRLYQASDEWLFIACGNVTFWNKLCLALDRVEWLEDPRFDGAPWNIPLESRDALRDMIAEIIRTKTRAEWLAHLTSNDVPCAPVQTREQFAKHPQVLHNGVLTESNDPVLGRMRAMALPIKMYGTPGAPGAVAPKPGEHTAEVLRELAYDAAKDSKEKQR